MQHVELHMQESDAFAWYMEKDPLLRSTIVAVALLDRVPDWHRVVEKLDRASRIIPGFRQHVVIPPLRLATPRWAVDPHFDLSWHLRRISAPEPKDVAPLLDFARKEGMSDFDRARPLWEFTLVEGLEGEAKAAIVLKLHHSLTDGVGGMQLALLLFDIQADPGDPGPMPDAPEGEHLGTFDLLKDALAYDAEKLSGFVSFVRHHAGSAVTAAAHAALHPAEAVGDVLKTARSVARTMEPVSDTLSPVMTDRRLSWRYDIMHVPLDDLKRASKVAGASVNDGYLAGIAGGFRRYHERHDRSVDALRVTLPINLRKEGDRAGGNRITLMRFKVPVGIVDVGERIARMRETTRRVRAEPSLPLTQAIAGTLNLMPRAYIGGMLKHVDFLASNVPGFSFPVHFGGARLLSYYAFGPTIGSSVNVTMMSYCDTCYIGVNTDTGAVTDTDVLLTSLQEGFEEVLGLAGGHRPVVLPLSQPARPATIESTSAKEVSTSAAGPSTPAVPARDGQVPRSQSRRRVGQTAAAGEGAGAEEASAAPAKRRSSPRPSKPRAGSAQGGKGRHPRS